MFAAMLVNAAAAVLNFSVYLSMAEPNVINLIFGAISGAIALGFAIVEV